MLAQVRYNLIDLLNYKWTALFRLFRREFII